MIVEVKETFFLKGNLFWFKKLARNRIMFFLFLTLWILITLVYMIDPQGNATQLVDWKNQLYGSLFL